MQVQAHKGDWVQIHLVVLEAGSRAPQVPEDTAKVPLEMKVKGSLVEESAAVGDTVSVETAVGRRITGKLVAIDPPYDVGFGPPPVELRSVGAELRRILKQEVPLS
ncbi:MAG: 2-amino-4-oxopentanoate thiolase subunit OrtA [Thermovirgaceae bacterium]|nr:2-amino-4-oxopentanoate thiolase subunit OrtA [Thermovirgaceae bacterium]